MVNGKKILSDFKFIQTYSKYDDFRQRKETWEESVMDRIRTMHMAHLGDKLDNPRLKELFDYAFEGYLDKRVLGSQRALQFGGQPILNHHSKIYNCVFTLVDRPKAFQEIMYWLLSGCGVGFSVQFRHVTRLPKIRRRTDGVKTFVIQDSIEGWADAIGVLLSSYYASNAPFPEYQNYRVDFDYSLIRPEGAHISGGFKAPGHKGLQNSIEKISKLLDAQFVGTEESEVSLKPVVVYDTLMHMSDAVLSGGVRRCLPEYSRVFMQDGVKQIKDVQIGESVLTPYGYKKVKNVFEQGKQKLVKIHTNNGWFECTPNHKMAVLNGLDKYEWKLASELTTDDYLITNTHSVDGRKTELPPFEYEKPPHSTTCRDISIPELDEDLAWLIGIVHGDGYVLYNPDRAENDSSSMVVIAFNKNQEELASKAKTQLERFGLDNIKTKFVENEETLRLICTSKQLAEYFHTHIKKPKTDIEIPEFIWNAKQDIKLSYVSGVIDSDGAPNNKPVILCTSIYKSFIQDLQKLLFSCGITSYIIEDKLPKNRNWNRKYHLSLKDIDEKNILNEVKTLNRKLKTTQFSKFGKRVPIDFIKQLELTNEQKNKIGFWGAKNINVGTIKKELGIDVALTPSKINLIEYEYDGNEQYTYDIEVEDVHQFYADGYLTHNSATICIFSKEDHDMMTAKTGDWYITNPQRGRSNNSVALLKDKTTWEEFYEIFESIRQFGEPAFVFVDDLDLGYNPCVEIGLNPSLKITEDVKQLFDKYDLNEVVTGSQACNLSEINGSRCNTPEDFYIACKQASILGTIQASYTDFKYLDEVTRYIIEREALLGVSITGFMNNPEVLLNPEVLRKGAEIVKQTNKEVAELIGINQSARTTCVKPSGTASIILETASGIHGEHAPMYFRHYQINKMDDYGKYLKEVNPQMFEESVWSTNGTDDVIAFPIQSPKGSKFKDDLTGVKLLEYVKLVQENWVEAGTNHHLCVNKSSRHNVSNTINVKDDEWDDVAKYIYENRHVFAGISLLSNTGDKDYAQAPFTEVFTPRQIITRYGDGALYASGLIVDALKAFNNRLWSACDTVMGIGEQLTPNDDVIRQYIERTDAYDLWLEITNNKRVARKLSDEKPSVEDYRQVFEEQFASNIWNYGLKKDWIRKAKKFANKYFGGDIKKMTYCLKDVYNSHKWNSIVGNIKEVDWTDIDVKPSYTDINTLGAISCSGGACEIIV
jgi:intein/homing endonuclease